MNWKLVWLALPCLCFSIALSAQKRKKDKDLTKNRIICTYGDVKPEDFAPAAYAVDSSADAVYLFDGGKSEFRGNTSEGSNKSDFDIIYTVHTRIRILKKNAFYLATLQIPLYVTSDFKQTLENIKAATYTKSGETVIVNSVSKNDIFQEKKDDKHLLIKLTLPNVSEGCIIEYNYTMRTPDPSNLFGWTFQKNYPVLWSEYEITYPLIFDYVFTNKAISLML